MGGMPSQWAQRAASPAGSAYVDARTLSKLKWRCRRGLLENDLFIERFFARFEATLTYEQVNGLQLLMDLPDNDLLDVLLGRVELQGELLRDDVQSVLSLLQVPQSPVTESLSRC